MAELADELAAFRLVDDSEPAVVPRRPVLRVPPNGRKIKPLKLLI